MPLLTDPDRLKRAARACMRTGSAPGPDGISWKAYRKDLDASIGDLARRLTDGTWRPTPPRRVSLPVGDKKINAVIPTVEDRIVHRALRGCIEPILDAAVYPDWMFGWRPGRTRVDALTYAAELITSGKRTWVADVDVASASRGAAVEQAIGWLARWIHDGRFLATARRAVEALPEPLCPGSGLTPLLTNLRLQPVDEQLADLAVVRVTDNYAVFCRDRPSAVHAYLRISNGLAALGLAANSTKSKVWRPNPEDLFLAG